jgi:hypothetical protein
VDGHAANIDGMTTLSPAKWRILTSLRRGHPDNARRVCNEQQADPAALMELQDIDLIEASIGAIETRLGDVKPTGLAHVAIALTAKGRHTVESDPQIRVVRWLIQGSNHAAAMQYLRRQADADDSTLRAMEDAGLIIADMADGTALIPLASFRKIPNGLFIRLTRKGRRYWALPSTESFPGLDVAAEYGSSD